MEDADGSIKAAVKSGTLQDFPDCSISNGESTFEKYLSANELAENVTTKKTLVVQLERMVLYNEY